MKVIAFMELCRYVSDGKPFWQYIVSSSTGCSDSQYFEELYNYYTTNKVSFWQPLFPLGILLFCDVFYYYCYEFFADNSLSGLAPLWSWCWESLQSSQTSRCKDSRCVKLRHSIKTSFAGFELWSLVWRCRSVSWSELFIRFHVFCCLLFSFFMCISWARFNNLRIHHCHSYWDMIWFQTALLCLWHVHINLHPLFFLTWSRTGWSREA